MTGWKWELDERGFFSCSENAPEHAVPCPVDLPGAQDSHVTGQGLLHEVRLAVKLPRLPRHAALEDLAGGVKPDWDVTGLQKRV